MILHSQYSYLYQRNQTQSNALTLGQSTSCHVMKALLKIILARNEKKLEAEISENQSGFRPGKGTRERLFNLRIIIQRYLEIQKPECMYVYVCVCLCVCVCMCMCVYVIV